jgi:hypothetical protein
MRFEVRFDDGATSFADLSGTPVVGLTIEVEGEAKARVDAVIEDADGVSTIYATRLFGAGEHALPEKT